MKRDHFKGKKNHLPTKNFQGIREFSAGGINCGLKSLVPGSPKSSASSTFYLLVKLSSQVKASAIITANQAWVTQHKKQGPSYRYAKLFGIYIYICTYIYNSLTISQRYPARVGYSNCLVLLIKCRPVKPPNNHPTKTWNFQRTFSFKASWKMKK